MSTITRAVYAHGLVDYHVKHQGYAPDWDAYKARLAEVEGLAPGLGAGLESPLVRLDEHVVALVNAAWLAGAECGERLVKREVVPSGDD
jgi:hypothetical protein